MGNKYTLVGFLTLVVSCIFVWRISPKGINPEIEDAVGLGLAIAGLLVYINIALFKRGMEE